MAHSQIKVFRDRMRARIDQLLNGPPAAGYTALPQSYGATTTTSGTAPATVSGLQTLPADPSKIEPKVWLASERTFLNWLRVSLLISSFALALFNAASDDDWVAQGMGLTYSVIAVAMVIYAWYMQDRRRTRIISRFGGHHDEPYGPVVVCVVIFTAVLVNFILRVNQRERLRNHPTPKNPWVTILNQVQSAFVLPESIF